MLGAFGELVDAGQVRAIGASNYSAERLAEALRVSAETRLPRFTVMQPELNLPDRDQDEGPLQELCIAEGIGVIYYYSLDAGYMTGEYSGAADLHRVSVAVGKSVCACVDPGGGRAHKKK